MQITNIIAQLRTTDLAASIRFYTTRLGFALEFQHEDFYAGVRAGGHVVHLKLVDEGDPSIEYVDLGDHFHLYFETEDVMAGRRTRAARWRPVRTRSTRNAVGTREFVIRDDQGHTLYFGQPL